VYHENPMHEMVVQIQMENFFVELLYQENLEMLLLIYYVIHVQPKNRYTQIKTKTKD
jgi:hypothetical protein